MKRLILIVFIFFNLFSLLSCFNKCRSFRYFDYNGIRINVHNAIVDKGDSLLLGINYEGARFLSEMNFDFGNLLHAQIDCDKGSGGDKYPLTRIKITSNSDFNAEFPANSSLNELVSVYGRNLKGEYVFGKVNDFLPSEINSGYLYMSQRPDIINTHKFTIEIERSDGQIMSATSEQILWN